MRLQKYGVLFDLDGTVLDSAPGITACFYHALRGLNRPVPPYNAMKSTIGKSLRDALATLLRTNDAKVIDEAVALYRERYHRIGMCEASVYDGIFSALEILRTQGFRTAIATAKHTEIATLTIRRFGLESFFDGVFGSDGTMRNTDKSSIIRSALSALSLLSSEAVMVGDTEYDIGAAHACGMKCIGVSYGYRAELTLRAAGADVIAHTPRDIPAFVRKFLD